MRGRRAGPRVWSKATPPRRSPAIAGALAHDRSSSIVGEHPEPASFETVRYLARAVAATRAHGYVPAAATDAQPTWLAASASAEGGPEPSASEVRRAHEILGWVRSLRVRDPDGYRAHLAACLAHDWLSTRDLPLAASAVRAFNLHLYYEIRGRRSRARRGTAGETDPPPRRDRRPANGGSRAQSL